MKASYRDDTDCQSIDMNKALDEIFPNPPSDIDIASLDINKIPNHVAIIMDGNGR